MAGNIDRYARVASGAFTRPGRTDITPPPNSTLLIGARYTTGTSNSQAELESAFAAAQTILGPLQCTRTYYSSGSPPGATYNKRLSSADLISVKDWPASDATLTSFLNSLNSGDRLIHHHEPEGPGEYASGAAYVAEFNAIADRIHGLVPTAKIGHAAGGYQYRSSAGNGWDGSYLPPATKCDFYAMDCYCDGWTNDPNAYGYVEPVQDTPQFTRWYSFVQDRGKELILAEWALGTVGNSEVSGTPARRAANIPDTIDWLRANGFTRASYWFCNYGPDGRQWQFTDAASIAAFNALVRG